jgi:chemotaxis protein histidine kinase CheA
MAASNRAKLISKLHTELKKRYSLPPAQPSRPLLEHLLYACLLQDASVDLADEGLAKCEQEFFDWNEVRVTTVTELTQVLSNMPEPAKTARRLKETLQAVFEEFYAFDLDHLKKENLGKAVAKFEEMPAMTPFVLSYTVQHGLGGHSIPVDYAAMVIMLATGIASQSEAAAGKVPGLERAIPKSKGVEFASLLHEAGVALMLDHKDKNARQLLDAVAKGASDWYDEWEASKKAAIRRVKKRRREEKAAADQEPETIEAETKTTKSGATKKTAAKSTPAKTKEAKSATSKAESTEPAATTAKTTDSKSKKSKTAAKSEPKKTTKKATTSTASKSSSTAKSKSGKATDSAKTSADKKSPAKKSTKKTAKKTAETTKSKSSKSSSKKSSNRKLSKRKPR